MTPEIITRDEFIVVGIRTVFERGSKNSRVFWKDKFLPRHTELVGAEKKYYAVFGTLPNEAANDRYEYVAGMARDSLEDIPVGMVGWVIPAGKYAEIDAVGRAGIHRASSDLLVNWLPGSGYELVQGPLFAYTTDAQPDGEEARWKVNIPVETPEALAQMAEWLKA